ncbi:MAG: T9SS type A sorting domain-containing protein [Chitinophagaceae bacterium]|nr:T9SS type A sorting domain-containing protein [Chitinophagaceae bacterium]
MRPHFLTRLLPTLLLLVLPFSYSISQPSTWESRGVGGGGSLFYPTINPANDNEFYITCDMSQLFHSTDFGLSYTQVPFTQLQTGSSSTYEFTNNNNIAYCIANDGNINYAVKTMDGGSNWTILPGNPVSEDVYTLKADYTNPGRIIMGYYDAIYISNDYGENFSLVKQAADAGAGITIGGVFFDADNIYIGTNEGIFYSSNGGAAFSILSTTGIPAAQAIFSFAAAKSGGVTRFCCISINKTDIYNGIQPWEYYGLIKGVYTMDAGTNIWSSKMTGIDINNDFMMFVGMAKNDINTIYLGGSDATTGGNSVLKTTNAGNTWSKVFITSNNQNIRTGWSGQNGDRSWGYGESCFGIAVAPNNANKDLFGDFGFVHKTSDGGATWQQAYVNTSDEHAAAAPTPAKQYYHSIGLENTSVWQVHWQDADNMFACFSDIRGLRSKDAGKTWGFDYTGYTANTMYRIAKHNTAATMFAATSGVHDMYQSTRLADNLLDNNDAGGSIIYSSDNGASWQLLHQFNHPVFWVATDPGNANRLYASVIHYGGGTGEGGIWRTNDLNNLATSSWAKLPNPPRTQGHPACIAVLNDGKLVCTYSGRRTDNGFTASSGVFLYDPGTNTWSDVSDEGMHYWTKDIVIDPADATQNTWYVAVFSGWGDAPNGKGGLYRTTNRGASWTKLTNELFDRVTSISFNPAVNNEAYLTTETQGLWRSADIRAATPTWSLVSNYPFRQPERVFFNPYNPAEIWISSFGNGLRLGLQSTTLPIHLLTFSGNRVKETSTLQWTTAGEETGDIFIIERSMDGRQFYSIGNLAAKGSGNNQYEWMDKSDVAVVYYRISIHSAAGKIMYSNTIKLSNNADTKNNIRLLQNPVHSNIFLEVNSERNGIIEIQLADITGRNVLRKMLNIQKGTNQLSINIPLNLSNNIYILKAKTADIETTKRVMIMH